MPVAGESPITERAAIEREAHVRAAVIASMDAAPVANDRYGAAAYGDRQPAARMSDDVVVGILSSPCSGVNSSQHSIACGHCARFAPRPIQFLYGSAAPTGLMEGCSAGRRHVSQTSACRRLEGNIAYATDPERSA